MQTLHLLLYQKETLTQMFSCEFCKIFQTCKLNTHACGMPLIFWWNIVQFLKMKLAWFKYFSDTLYKFTAGDVFSRNKKIAIQSSFTGYELPSWYLVGEQENFQVVYFLGAKLFRNLRGGYPLGGLYLLGRPGSFGPQLIT